MTDVLVLCYHAVSPSWTAALSVTPEALERQVSLLVRRGWCGATFTQAVLAPPARRTLAVTFDDAFASVADVARPILSSLGVPATVFAPTRFMSTRQPLTWTGIDHWQGTSDARELISMAWDDLGDLADRGWEIGSHTHTHPHLTQLSDEALRNELESSFEACTEHLDSPCRSIAYPYGDVDARVAARAGAAGYRAGAALSRRLDRLDTHRWPRIGIYHRDFDARFCLKVTPAMRHLRAWRLWPKAE